MRSNNKECLPLPSNKVFQDRALASTLTAHHSKLWQVQGHLDTQRCKGILQPVDQWDQGLHPLIAGRHFPRYLFLAGRFQTRENNAADRP